MSLYGIKDILLPKENITDTKFTFTNICSGTLSSCGNKHVQDGKGGSYNTRGRDEKCGKT